MKICHEEPPQKFTKTLIYHFRNPPAVLFKIHDILNTEIRKNQFARIPPLTMLL